MKKTIIAIFVAACCVVSASAQESERVKGTVTKKGRYILPAKGDFAIGIDANPFLNYAIGLFNPNDAPTFDGYNGNLYGKYFVRDNQAIRARLLLNIGGMTDRYRVTDDEEVANNPLNPDATTFDVRKMSITQAGLYGGYEWRRGYGRLQAFVGGEFGFDFGVHKTAYEWGNPMTELNNTPSSNPNWTGSTNPGEREVKVKGANTFGLQLGGFAGVEFFFAPKMSIGGELGLGFRYETMGQMKVTTQKYNADKHIVEETTSRGTYGGRNDWRISTPINGNIFLMFHF